MGGAGTDLLVQSAGSTRFKDVPALTITGNGAWEADGLPEGANSEYGAPTTVPSPLQIKGRTAEKT
jgi:hypothetical protein